MSFALALDASSAQLGAVRRWVAEALAGVDEDDLEDCVLAVNELVSNAFDHAGGPRRVRPRWSSGRCVVRAEVDDASPDGLVLGRSRLGGSRGRGLVIAERLCEDWGVDARVEGRGRWLLNGTASNPVSHGRGPTVPGACRERHSPFTPLVGR